MTADRTSAALTTAEVETVLVAHGFGTDRPRSGAVVLAVLDPLRIVWANAAAAALFDTTDVEDLHAQIFAGRGREGLGGTVGRLTPDGSPRLERLRLIRGFRSRTLTVLMSLSRLADGRGVVIVSAPGHDLSSGETPGFDRSVLDGPVAEDRSAPAAPAPADRSAPATADPMMAAVRERLAALRSARLLWQTDAEHRLVKLTQGVPDMLGVDDPAVIGRPLADLLRVAGSDAEGRLAAMLAAHAPWSGLGAAWPLATAPAAVGVTLGAVPINGRAGFGGFRGFGVVDLTQLLPAGEEAAMPPAAPDPVEPTQDNAPPPHAPMDARLPQGSPIPPTGGNAAAEPAADGPAGQVASERAAVDAVEPPPAARGFASSSKVVALRPYQTFGAFGTAPAAPPVPAAPVDRPPPPSDVDEADVLDLSTIERSNFNEIGRTLLGDARPAEPAAPPAAPRAVDHAADIVATLAAGLLVVDGDRLLQANPAFAALTGYGSLDALREAGGLAYLFGGLDPRLVLVADEDRAVPLIGAAGAVLPMEGRLQPIAWGEGEASLLSLRPAQDRIAQVQGLEEQVRRREAELAESRAVLDHVGEAVVMLDRQSRIIGVNGAAERLFGYAENGIVGEALATLLGAEGQAAVAGDAEAGHEGRDIAGRTAAGDTLPLRMTWHGLGPERLCVVLRDRRERLALDQDLAAARGRLDQAVADKPDLLAKISHELRTPLNAILGFAEVILDERFGPIGNARYKAYLRDIHDSGAHVLSLLNDLLDLSKMEAGRRDMHPAAVDVNRLVGECVGEMQTTAHRERVIVRLSLLPHLSAALVDERAFRQIVGNILSNAINFNEPGGQVIVSTAMSEAGAVAVRVRDTGIGMSEGEIAQAMEPFRQIKAAKPGTGNGLGLPLARALVEANNATMSIKSRKDEGTLVEIVLPSIPAEPMRMPAE